MVLRGGGWEVNATRRNLYKPLPTSGTKQYLDVAIKRISGNPRDAHGIIGQSFGRIIKRDGKLDNYTISSEVGDRPPASNCFELVAAQHRPMPCTIPHALMVPGARSCGAQLTTVAQAEGAIDGIYTDYMLSEPYATSFKFSKFGTKPSAILVGDASRTQSASTDTADATGEADDDK